MMGVGAKRALGLYRSCAPRQQRVAIAANLHARVPLRGLSPDQGLVENLLAIVHEVCVSSTSTCSRRTERRAKSSLEEARVLHVVDGAHPLERSLDAVLERHRLHQAQVSFRLRDIDALVSCGELFRFLVSH